MQHLRNLLIIENPDFPQPFYISMCPVHYMLQYEIYLWNFSNSFYALENLYVGH